MTALYTNWSLYSGKVNQVGHLSKTQLNLLEMCEICCVDAAMFSAQNCYQTMYMGAPNKMLLKLSHFS